MAIIIPFLIAIVVGFALFCLILKRHPFSSWLDIIIAFWMGVGACSLMTFYTVVIGHAYNPSLIMGVSIFFCICSLPVCWQQLSVINVRSIRRPGLKDGVFVVLAIVIACILQYIAAHNPFGDWDAWSFWNYLPHYFFSGGTHIKDLFTIASEARHPWFLPCWTLFGGTWMWQESVVFPLVSAQVFSLMLMATMYYAIYEQTKGILLAALGALWMFGVTVFLFHSMSQYADVLMANLICVNVLLLMRFKRMGVFNIRDAVMTGVLFGLMAFLKDDGMLCAGIMLLLFIVSIKVDLKGLIGIVWAFMSVFAASIIVKVWMTDLPKEPEHLYLPYLWDISRWGLVFSYFNVLFVKQIGGGVFLLPLGLIIFVCTRRCRPEESLAGLFLLLYVGVFVVFLVLRHNLRWYFDGTAYRFIYQLVPVLMVIFFSVLAR